MSTNHQPLTDDQDFMYPRECYDDFGVAMTEEEVLAQDKALQEFMDAREQEDEEYILAHERDFEREMGMENDQRLDGLRCEDRD